MDRGILRPSWTPPKWDDVEKWAKEEIEKQRNLLEASQPEAITLQIRGQIHALRRLLTLGEPPAPADPSKRVQPATPDY